MSCRLFSAQLAPKILLLSVSSLPYQFINDTSGEKTFLSGSHELISSKSALKLMTKNIISLALLFYVSGYWPVLAAEPVRISVTNQNISFLPAGVALRKGYFRDEGLDVEVIRMNTPNTITALITGDIGYTLLLGSVIRGALRGMPLRVVASLLDSPTHAVVTKTETKSLKELRGKTIGIGNFGGTDEVVAKMVFKNAGIDPDKELKIIAVGPDRARLAALKENLVSAAIIAPPADVVGKQMGFSVLVRAYD